MRASRAGEDSEALADGRFNPGQLLVGTDAVYWVDNDFVSCARLLQVDKGGGAPRDITPPDQELYSFCQIGLLGERDGRLLLLVPGYESGRHLIIVDPTGDTPPTSMRRLDDELLEISVGASSTYAILRDLGGSYLARFETGSPYPSVLASSLRYPFGVIVTGSGAYWIDRDEDFTRRYVAHELTQVVESVLDPAEARVHLVEPLVGLVDAPI